jgi:adenylate cyclase
LARALDILCALAEAGGSVVSKEALLSRIWSGQVVEENALQAQISQLRKSLGAAGALHIVTVAGRGYRLAGNDADDHAAGAQLPAIAVLPFANLSGDPEQRYFADGMVEDITTALSRIGTLLVIARKSSFTYDHPAVDVKQVGRELGVRYVLEGSVRKAGGRVRIACQLANADSGAHVWADRFDGTLSDVFDLQDRVAEAVAGAIEPTLRKAEIERAANKPTGNLDAYDLYLRALSHYDQFTRTDFEEALDQLQRAIALDPRFALAKALASWCAVWMVHFGWRKRDSSESIAAIELARSAIATARDDPTTLRFAGHAIAHLGLDAAAGRMALDRAIALNPNSAPTLMASGYIWIYMGNWAAARGELLRAMALSPLDPEMRFVLNGLSIATEHLGDVEQALGFAARAMRTGHGAGYGWMQHLHCLMLLGRTEEATEIAREILRHRPDLTLSAVSDMFAPFLPSHRESRVSSLRAAGIPE